ncbi:MAG TPA: hypothetical protein VLE96_02055, partial [Chlamydiales bacterium]|nr:hypothetical protein [Chlamydiales bacterium]
MKITLKSDNNLDPISYTIKDQKLIKAIKNSAELHEDQKNTAKYALVEFKELKLDLSARECHPVLSSNDERGLSFQIRVNPANRLKDATLSEKEKIKLIAEEVLPSARKPEKKSTLPRELLYTSMRELRLGLHGFNANDRKELKELEKTINKIKD